MSTHAQIRNFHLQRINQGDVQVLSFSGALDSDASCRVDKELVHLLEQKHRRVILELSLLNAPDYVT